MARLRKKDGREAFLSYYRTLFPAAEFEAFLNALSTENWPVLRFNKIHAKALKKAWANAGLPWETLDWHPHALRWPDGWPKGDPLPGYDEGWIYPQNPSSLLPVLALDPHPNDTVLDACAAPGGKTLFLADLMEHQGTLIANDRSPLRRERLKKILKKYAVDGFVYVENRNAATLFKTYPNQFDKILLDAPCSSEKHVWNDPTELARWKPGRIRHLKNDQWALLNGLLRALKPGGRLVYSTCAVTPEENEPLIEKFLQKNPTLTQRSLNPAWPHDHGRVHPHRHPGMDPMFVAILEKSASAEPAKALSSNQLSVKTTSQSGTKRSSHRQSPGRSRPGKTHKCR